MHLEKFSAFGFFRFVTLAVTLLVGISPVVAQDEGEEEDYGEQYDTIPIPDGLNKEDLRGPVTQALAGRGWVVKEQSDRRVIGYLKHRRNEATVTYVFDGEQITVYCVGWALGRGGVRAKPEMPKGWLGNLRKDIIANLNAKALQRGSSG